MKFNRGCVRMSNIAHKCIEPKIIIRETRADRVRRVPIGWVISFS